MYKQLDNFVDDVDILLRTTGISRQVHEPYIPKNTTKYLNECIKTTYLSSDGTFLDNQVHVAHNNKIGDNCIIAGQVGFAGSSTLGDNVMIGGQAGISGHLKIGKNVHIGGGSGVIKDIEDNTKVMGYPAKNLRDFIKENR